MFLSKDIFSTVIENAPLISIDLVVKNKDKKVLLGKRLNKPAFGSWFVPGGRVFKDEKVEDAFKRITENEIGICMDISNASFKGIYQHFYNDNVFDDDFSTHYIVMGFEINIEQDPVLNNQHENYKWFSEDELMLDENVYTYVKDYFKKEKGIK